MFMNVKQYNPFDDFREHQEDVIKEIIEIEETEVPNIIVIVDEYEEGKFQNYVVVNPKIISHSEEIIAAELGEGCLSVNRDVEGHVKRFARVTIEGFDEHGNKLNIRAREELSIAFQHEIDHLNGILFYDHIDKKHPFITDGSIRLI